MKAKWLNRLLVVSPCYIALCTTEKQFKALLKHLKIPKSSQPAFIATWHSDATTHFFDNKEMMKVAAIVCIKHRDGTTQNQVSGLLVHEGMHIWQEVCRLYGEDNPSHEFEAYSVQNIFQNLLEEFTRQTKGDTNG